jgi:anti-anti-sigma factor
VGEIDSAAEESLERAYREAAHGRTAVVLNFTGTDYINSTGIALIVGLLAQARARGISLTACGLTEHYREIFEITRLSDFMRLADSEDGAIGAGDA